eukprot:gene19189-25035_t
MNDPLSILRYYITNNKSYKHENDEYIFESIKFKDNVETCFRRTLQDSNFYYSLKDIIFFIENSGLNDGQYRKQAMLKRVTAVVNADRSDLKDYLNSKIDTCPQIDLVAANNFINSHAVESTPEESVIEKDIPSLPQDQLEELRQKHAALLDESLNKSSSIATVQSSNVTMTGVSSEKLEEMRLLRRTRKRKDVTLEKKYEDFDPMLIHDDKKILKELRVRERPNQTRNSILEVPNADFSFVLKIFNDQVLKPIGSSSNPNENVSNVFDESPVKKSKDDQSVKRVEKTPIIIVPSALTSCITSVNAVDFLQNGNYITVEEKLNQGGGRRVVYKIIDNPSTENDFDWSRVVAVFASGQPWQFKNWKWTNPVELFQNVLGVHLTMDDRLVDANIQSWNCKILRVYRFKKHLDSEAANEFWAYFDEFVRVRKPFLLPKPQ